MLILGALNACSHAAFCGTLICIYWEGVNAGKDTLFSLIFFCYVLFFLDQTPLYLVFLTNLYPHLFIYHDHQSWDVKVLHLSCGTTLGVPFFYIYHIYLPD